ncbi:hypothetical protein BN1723_004301 [Verticillium longisporum]|uniref:AAA ATPase AAA+ lid domain-containing protein n=1 Tax=Verticillium longisporum TaxID=100787 RepID=A0A0G4MTA9_VERLO|nr:hypothetical protein BN1723_004301 [Verticillium longisporum]
MDDDWADGLDGGIVSGEWRVTKAMLPATDGLNGADLRNVVTEAGLFAIKDYRDAISQDDFNKAVRKVAESKKLEGKLEYQKL